MTLRPTNRDLYSVHMIAPDDGLAVDKNGTIVRWTGTEWVPEFPSLIILPLFMTATLLTIVVDKKKHSI